MKKYEKPVSNIIALESKNVILASEFVNYNKVNFTNSDIYNLIKY